jgi:hypothetical protein
MCGLLIALMMEAASTSEALVNFYQTIRRYNPEDSHLHTCRHENLKSYIIKYDNNHRLPKSLKLFFTADHKKSTANLESNTGRQ